MKTPLKTWFARLGLLLVSAVVSLELVLQIASLFASDRFEARLLTGRETVLCLGDSHTYGVLVPAAETYPAHLQGFLDASAPGGYSVINLGIPGMNASQIRTRLRDNLERFRPAVAVVWVGTNDIWNHMEIGAAARTRRSDAAESVLLHSRAYRFFRNLANDLRLHAELDEAKRRGIRDEIEVESADSVDGLKMIIREDGAETEFVAATDPRRRRRNDHIEDRIYLELREIEAILRAAGVELVLIRYPLDFGTFAVANFAIKTFARDARAPIVDTSRSLARIPRDQVEWLYGNHPNAALYREIASDVAVQVLELSTAAAP